MKKILGLDLGTTSIGWALVNEAENNNEKSSIIKLGVRVNPLTIDEQTDFEKGKSITINAERTKKRSSRRNLQRYKIRRDNLIEVLKENQFINENTILAEDGKNSTHNLLKLRTKAVVEKLEKSEIARVFLAINKKRGYKSSRKAKNENEGIAIDGMSVAKKMYNENLTPGQYCYNLLKEGEKFLPDFYRSDLQNEFETIWNFQKTFYPEILNDEFYTKVKGQGQRNTAALFRITYNIFSSENKGNREEKKLQAYKWRSIATNEKIEISELAYVLSEINNNLNQSSGYLGEISDRSKELYFNNQTVGQYLYAQIKHNKHNRLKGQVFYRQDYLDEFEKIWETQRMFYPEMDNNLKEEIRDIIIFYQRRLKSQKSLVSFCEFESQQKEVIVDGNKKIKTIGSRVAPKSSPLFQEFKIWQNLSNLVIRNKNTKREFDLGLEQKQILFDELNIKGNLKKEDILALLVEKPNDWEINYNVIEGNRTNQVFYETFKKILEFEGNEIDFNKLPAEEIKNAVTSIFESLGINTEILSFNSELDGKNFEKQASWQLWHLLFSYDGENEKLYQLLNVKFGFKREYAQIISNIIFQDDYGSLSTKAIRKIMPFIKEHDYSEACKLAGYNHSFSITRDENEKRVLKEKLDLLPKNSLRNPVVEKILNQMVNVINAIIHDTKLGRPDEIRIELARELKKNAKERTEMTQNINKAKVTNEQYRKLLQNEFGIKNPTRNDIIRYKLYLELKTNGFKTLYTNTYIPRERLFSKEFDIEHIVPQARLFDDSFSNKTLAVKQINIDKSDNTAYDFIKNTFGEVSLNDYTQRVEKLYKANEISKAKYKKLLMRSDEIGEGFINRDLRESQYIAKKARQMLLDICKSVVSTSGSITDYLREDWGLINVMQEINLPKYRLLGLTEMIEMKDGSTKERIIDWSKRNDHRHHAMDALTVAFTKHNHIQYLNNLNARKNENNEKHANIYAIEQKETFRDEHGKRHFNLPMPNFRSEAKKHLENILISFKAKNKVVTRNRNKIKGSDKVQIASTPRGQMHKDTIYGSSYEYITKEVKLGTTFDKSLIRCVSKKAYREALLKRLAEFNNDPKKAFGGKNSPSKNPIYHATNATIPEKIKLVTLEQRYTIRKEITPDIRLDKVIDAGVRKILQNRLDMFNGNTKEAFSNLDKDPIWLNKEKGIKIKSVVIYGVNNAEILGEKINHKGEVILSKEGKPIPSHFVSTGNNHHVAIYRDEHGNLQEEVISFYEAVARVNSGLPIINKQHKNGWEFLFTMKQNEMFVFPSDNFEPSEIDLLNPENYSIISPNLFRVQKFTTKDYFFRHHLETDVADRKETKGITWKREGIVGIEGIMKVRINHLGKIVKVGEY